MSGITLEIAQAQLDLWITADQRVAKNQSYTIGNRVWTRADADKITAKIDYWSAKVGELSGTRRRGVSYTGLPG